MVGPHVGQQVGQDLPQLDVVQVALFDAFLGDGVRRVAQQVGLWGRDGVKGER